MTTREYNLKRRHGTWYTWYRAGSGRRKMFRRLVPLSSRVDILYYLAPMSVQWKITVSIAIDRKRLGEQPVLRPESCSMTRTVSPRLCEQKLVRGHVPYFLPLSRAAGRDGATRGGTTRPKATARLQQLSIRCHAVWQIAVTQWCQDSSHCRRILMLSYQLCPGA